MKVYGSDDPEVSRGKPHPDIFTVAASRFDLHHHPLLNILAQVWSATSLARELPGHRGQHGWCGGWAPCWDAGDQLIISRYKLRVGKSANLSRWWWWPTGAPAIQEQRQCCPPWKSSALKNGDCQPWRASKKEKIPCDTNITHYLHTQHIPSNLKTSPPQFNLLLYFYLCRSFTLHFFVRVCGWLSNIHTSGPNPWFEIFFHHDATSSKIFIDGNIFICISIHHQMKHILLLQSFNGMSPCGMLSSIPTYRSVVSYLWKLGRQRFTKLWLFVKPTSSHPADPKVWWKGRFKSMDEIDRNLDGWKEWIENFAL